MRLSRISVQNHARVGDLDLEVRSHLVLVGANAVGKSSLLRLLHLLLGASTAQLYSSLTVKDLRSSEAPLTVSADFVDFDEDDRSLFHREIDVAPQDRSESLTIRLEAILDPDDDEVLLIHRWSPGRGEVRNLSREQLVGLGWRFVATGRGASSVQLDGPTGAVQTLLRAVHAELGGEREILATLLENYNERLRDSDVLGRLRAGMAGRLSTAMPRSVTSEELAIRTAADPTESVLDGVALFFTGADGSHASLAEQSDGVRQLMAITLFELAEAGARIMAFDEPELHLHPLSQRTVADLLTEGAAQKVIATHSPHVIQRFDPTEVVAIGPVGRCRQIDPTRFPVADRVQAHWWNPAMLEALTARLVILVEGVADRLIVEAAARARGLSLDRLGVLVFELGGADNFAAVYKLLGPNGFGIPVLGLVDEAESTSWLGTVGGRPKNVLDVTVFVSTADLEEEYCRGIGSAAVAERLIAAGVARSQGLVSSCEATSVEEITAEKLAAYCRGSTKGQNRKVPAALAIGARMTEADARAMTSIRTILDRVEELTSG